MEKLAHTSSSAARKLVFAIMGCAVTIAGDVRAQNTVERFVTRGPAKTVVSNLYKCPVKVENHRVSGVAKIKSAEGRVITVPAETAFQKGNGRKGADLFNECNGVTPAKAADVSTAKVPVVEIDKNGELITGYIVADNYFEFYVNGKLVAVDPIPYTPFNSVIVKFKAKKPITYAFKLVDWEEHLGLGMELFKENPWHPGDGGLVARFSDGTVTDDSWKAQSFYIAPLNAPDEVVEQGNVHDTSELGRVHPQAKKPNCQEKCYAVHYPMPAKWSAASFDDSKWPQAYEYTDAEVGVTNLPAYTKYPELFEGAHWIWSVNLVFDNLVLVRKTVR